MKDIDLILEIFKERIYDEPVALEFKLSKFKDKRLLNGLVIDLFCKSDTYNISKDKVSGFINLEIETDELMNDHDYYIDFLHKQPKVTFYDYLLEGGDLAERYEFQNFIKNLSQEDFEEIVDYCVELEIYEVIPYIKNLR